jgi:type II secretory pathway pseudopilin PulG
MHDPQVDDLAHKVDRYASTRQNKAAEEDKAALREKLDQARSMGGRYHLVGRLEAGVLHLCVGESGRGAADPALMEVKVVQA